jgi:hypothetical protein
MDGSYSARQDKLVCALNGVEVGEKWDVGDLIIECLIKK